MESSVPLYEILGLGDDLPVDIKLTHVVDDDPEIEVRLVRLDEQGSSAAWSFPIRENH